MENLENTQEMEKVTTSELQKEETALNIRKLAEYVAHVGMNINTTGKAIPSYNKNDLELSLKALKRTIGGLTEVVDRIEMLSESKTNDSGLKQ